MRFRISHVTRYLYAEPVSLCHSIAHLKPRTRPRQRPLWAQVRVDPWPAVSREHTDFFGNRTSYFSIQQSHTALEVAALSEVEVVPAPPPSFADSPPWEQVVEQTNQRPDGELVNLAACFSPQNFVCAYAAATGKIVWTYDTNRSFDTINGVKAMGGSIDGPGPVVAGGMLYVTAGNAGFVGRAGNVLLAFAVKP